MTMNSITARLNFNYHTRDSNQRTVFPGVAVNKAVVFYLKLETYFVYRMCVQVIRSSSFSITSTAF